MRVAVRLGALFAFLAIVVPSALAQGGNEWGGNEGGTVDTTPVGAASCTAAGSCEVAVTVGTEANRVGSGTISPCHADVGPYEELRQRLPVVPAGPGPEEPEEAYVLVWCPYGGTDTTAGFGPAADGPPPGAMAETVRRAVVAPPPDPQFSPGSDVPQVVGLQTWVWLPEDNTATQTARGCIGLYACADITTAHVGFAANMGDGSDPLACEGGGTPYDSSRSEEWNRDQDHCGHTYIDVPDGDAYDVQTNAQWHVTWSCLYDPDNAGNYRLPCAPGALPPLVLTTTTALDIVELQAIATG